MSSAAFYRVEIAKLDATRKKLEEQIVKLNEQEQELIGDRPLGCPLIDSQGFPLAEIDVHSIRLIRHDRAKHIYDLEQCNREIETKIFELHRLLQSQEETEDDEADQHQEQQNDTPAEIESDYHSSANVVLATPTINAQSHPPVFRVSAVADASPAAAAGIQIGDEIIQFGIYDAHNTIIPFPQYLQTLENTPTLVTVLRQGEVLQLQLTPSTWTGRGLLGCQIIPL